MADEKDTCSHAESPDAVEQDKLGTLMQAAQRGDQAAYRDLLRQVARKLRGAVHCRAPWLKREDVEDVVQDILLSVHQARGSYDPARPFTPWLMTIARNRLADHARRYCRQTAGEHEHVQHSETFSARPANNHADTVNDYLALRDAITELPAAQRQALRMLRLRQMSLKEAAEATGISVAALKVSLHRATMRLREIVKGPD